MHGQVTVFCVGRGCGLHVHDALVLDAGRIAMFANQSDGEAYNWQKAGCAGYAVHVTVKITQTSYRKDDGVRFPDMFDEAQ